MRIYKTSIQNLIYIVMLFILSLRYLLYIPFVNIQFLMFGASGIEKYISTLLILVIIIYVSTYLIVLKRIKFNTLSVLSIIYILIFLFGGFINAAKLNNFGMIIDVLKSQFLSVVVLPITLIFPPNFTKNQIRFIVAAFSAIVALNVFISLMQNFTNSQFYITLLDYRGTDMVNSIMGVFEKIRTFGTVSSGFSLGIILTLALFYLVVKLSSNIGITGKIVILGLVALLSFNIYITYTRNAYIIAAYCLLFYFVVSGIKYINLKKIVSFFIILLAPIIYLASTLLYFAKDSSTNTILSTLSFAMRLRLWEQTINDFMYNSDFVTVLLGNFTIQSSGGINTVDNIYLFQLRFLGILGLLVFLSIIIVICVKLSKQIYDKISCMIMIYLSSVFVAGVMNLPEMLMLTGVIGACIYMNREEAVETTEIVFTDNIVIKQ